MTWEKYHTVWAIMIFGWVTNYMVRLLYFRRNPDPYCKTFLSFWERVKGCTILKGEDGK